MVAILFVGLLALLLTGSEAQDQTFQFSSFDQIPKSLLAQMSSDQIANLKQQFAGGSPGSSSTFQIGGSPSGSPSAPPSSGPTQTLQFSSFSQIPQSVLSQMSPEQIANIKQQFAQASGQPSYQPAGQPSYQPAGQPSYQPSGNIPTFQGGIPVDPNSPLAGKPMQFSSFSQIPQSVLDHMSPEQIENIKKALAPTPGQIIQQPAQPSGGIPSFQIGQPLDPNDPLAGQQLQFTSYSQIPQSVLDKLTPEQRENIRKALEPTVTVHQIPGKPTEPQTFEFSSYSQIPSSILDQFSPQERENIKNAFKNGNGADMNTITYSIPGGDNKKVNNVVNLIYNYFAAGGFLTGVPPIDLLLLRFYVNEGPKSFCK